MLGRKEFTPKRFYEFSLEARPERPLAARIGAALDLSFVRALTARFYSHTGRPGSIRWCCSSRCCSGTSTASRRSGGWRGGAPAPGLPLVLGVTSTRRRRTTRCCPRRGRASACPCTRLSPRWCAVRAGRPGAGRRPLRGQHAGQGQCQSWVGRRAALLTQLPSERAGYVATVWQENPVSDPTPASGLPRRGSQRRTRPVAFTAGAARRARLLHVAGPGRAQRGPGGR